MGRAAVMLCLAAILTRLLWTGGFGWFVQQRMKWPLIGAAIVLGVFGLYEMLAAAGDPEDDGAATSRRPVGPAVGWLLIAPLLVLVSVAPTGLGAAAASRVDAYTPVEAAENYPPIDDSAGPVEMRVFDFLDRAVWDESRSLSGTTVRLEGLVVNDPTVPDGFLLTRFLVSCCAADGIPLQVAIRDTAPLPDDTWVTADVVWHEPSTPYIEQEADWLIEADLVSLTVADAPKDAYESPY